MAASSGSSTPTEIVADERESDYGSNSLLESSTADWINDSTFVQRQVERQKQMSLVDRRLSDYFGAVRVD
jgi:hypothetical protein